MNLIEKMWALFVDEKIHIWHFPAARDKQFVYTLDKWQTQSSFNSLEEMVNEAYKHIDPLLKPLPPLVPPVFSDSSSPRVAETQAG